MDKELRGTNTMICCIKSRTHGGIEHYKMLEYLELHVQDGLFLFF